MFLDRSLEIWRKDNIEDCEKPLPWPKDMKEINNQGEEFEQDMWKAYGFACNYALCEPPPPNCLCCKNPSCVKAVSIKRGF